MSSHVLSDEIARKKNLEAPVCRAFLGHDCHCESCAADLGGLASERLGLSGPTRFLATHLQIARRPLEIFEECAVGSLDTAKSFAKTSAALAAIALSICVVTWLASLDVLSLPLAFVFLCLTPLFAVSIYSGLRIGASFNTFSARLALRDLPIRDAVSDDALSRTALYAMSITLPTHFLATAASVWLHSAAIDGLVRMSTFAYVLLATAATVRGLGATKNEARRMSMRMVIMEIALGVFLLPLTLLLRR